VFVAMPSPLGQNARVGAQEVAWRQVHDDEGEHRNPEERRDRQQHAAKDESGTRN